MPQAQSPPFLYPFQTSLIKAQKRGVPLIAVNSQDQFATLSIILPSLPPGMPLLVWDIVRGVTGFGLLGENFAEFINSSLKPEDLKGAGGLPELLTKLKENHADLPNQAFTLACLNINEGLKDSAVVQSILNSRDWLATGGEIQGKQWSCSLILLAPSFTFPLELSQDFHSLTDEPPNEERLKEIIRETAEWAGAPIPQEPALSLAAESILSLNEFSARQEISLALSSSPTWTEGLGARRKAKVDATPGLEMYSGNTSFLDVGGYGEAKQYLQRLFAGPLKPSAIMFFDEIEKQLGNSNDSSGVSLRMLGTLLSYMSENKVSGILLHGVPGSGKTALSQACSGEFKIPFVSNDLSAVQNSLVGKSEEQLRNNLAIDKSLGRGKSLWIATCNEISRIPTPLLRRFDLAVFTFDLPTEEERSKIWPIQLKAFGLDLTQPLPPCDNWTGSDIQKCCKSAFALSISVIEASQYVIPVATARPETIEQCHKEAEGKILSASYPGPFKRSEASKRGRAINLDKEGEDQSSPPLVVFSSSTSPFQFSPGEPQEPLPKKDKIGFGMGERSPSEQSPASLGEEK